METAGYLRLGLLIGCTGMSILALLYLRHNKLNGRKKWFWVFLALMLPALGPFWVIFFRAGNRQGRAKNGRYQLIRERFESEAK